MIISGLVSVSFRGVPALELIEITVDNNLSCIEWGGDAHVPHGDLETAAIVRRRMDEKNLSCAAYGSYYRAGVPDQPDFEGIARTAVILGAATVRVWAGNVGSDECTGAQWDAVIADLRRVCAIAVSHGLSVSTEYHRGTITDTNDSAVRMLAEITMPGFHTYWQPPVAASVEYRLAGLDAVLPRLTNIHVFHWRKESGAVERLPLKAGADEWRQYFATIRRSGLDHAAMLEFIKGDSLAQLREDAACLNELIRDS